MTDTLPNARAIVSHLLRRGRQAILHDGYVSLHARIHDFPTHINIQFRSSSVVRASIAFPTTVVPALRGLFALKLLELNRTGLGVSAVMMHDGIGVVSQIPVDVGGVTGTSVDRMVARVTEHALAVYPVLTRLEARGMAAV